MAEYDLPLVVDNGTGVRPSPISCDIAILTLTVCLFSSLSNADMQDPVSPCARAGPGGLPRIWRFQPPRLRCTSLRDLTL
jgi:hypothetical protein